MTLSPCWLTARQFGKFGIGSSMFARRSPEVLVLTAIHSKPCIYPEGDHLNLRSVINKQVMVCPSLASAKHANDIDYQTLICVAEKISCPTPTTLRAPAK
jgi:hypothetical protein